MTRCRTSMGYITVAILLHSLIQLLGGGSYLEIRRSAAISPAKFYSCVYKCIDSILDCEDLENKFPDTAKELEEA